VSVHYGYETRAEPPLAMSSLALSVLAALTVLSAGIAGISLWFTALRPKPPDVSTLAQRIHALELGHADLVDKVSHWQRRDRVRKLRDANEPAGSEPEVLAGETAKDRLRRQVFGTWDGGFNQ
ncbi:MAG: hypothetical protein ACREJC_07160, partial [Tepidisphaeraceae bacterium]